MKRWRYRMIPGLLLCVTVWSTSGSISALGQQDSSTRTTGKKWILETGNDGIGRVSKGDFEVFENRTAASGRKLHLKVVILRALNRTPRQDPVFFLAGGPGLDATTLAGALSRSWMRQDRDIVLVAQRGTGGTNRLQFPGEGAPSGPDQYLDAFITPAQAREARSELAKTADLTMYSTCDAMDDLNDIRRALGYGKINLIGGSYGTRAALVYIRQHGETVRTAILNGVVPIEFVNPLYHAREAQAALDLIFDEVEANEVYRSAFPDLRNRFSKLLEKLEKTPVKVEVSGQTIELTRDLFAASLRYQLYYLDTSRRVPLMLWQAIHGDYAHLVSSMIDRNRSLRNDIATGMLLCVTAAEDIDRIDPSTIQELSKGTFLGESRVRKQIAACADWPRSKLPEDYGVPVTSDVPTLILSGTIDPVTPPRYGELVHEKFPRSLHLVVPGAHGVDGPCVESIQKRFLATGTVEGLDTRCINDIKLPPLALPPRLPK